MKKTILIATMMIASFQATAACKTIITEFGKVLTICEVGSGSNCKLVIDPTTGKSKVVCL